MKNTKRILLICSAVIMMVAFMAVAISAETFTGDVLKNDAGNTNDLTWTFDDATGVLTFSGTSKELVLDPAPSWNTMGPETVPWYAHIGAITKVVVEAPIETMCGYAFNQMSACKVVVMPDTKITLKGSMVFSNMKALTTFGPEGTPEGVIDLRNFTGESSQCFENSCLNTTIRVLMPAEGKAPINDKKVFGDSTTAIFMVVAGSPSATMVEKIKNTSAETSPYADVITVENYDGTYNGATAPTDTTVPTDTTTAAPETPVQTLQETKTTTAIYGTPVIDGDIDEAWDLATEIDFPYDRQNASEESLADLMSYQDEFQKPWAKVMWDAKNLYILAFVPDGDLQVDSSILSYNRDGIEIYIDELNEKKATRDEATSFHQLQFVADGSFAEGQGAETKYSTKVYEGYYVIEVAYTFHATAPKQNMVMGFDISVNCNNTGNNIRDYCLSWNDRTNVSYKCPMYMGNLQLTGGEGVNAGVDIPVKEEETTAAPETPANPGDVILTGSIDAQYSKCTWTLTADGTLTILAKEGASGWNEVPYYKEITENGWLDKADMIKKVVIGAGLQKVGASAFKDCPNLEIVEWTSIGQLADNAFDNCPKLTTIYKAGNEPVVGTFDLTSISSVNGANHFINCGVTSVNLNNKMTKLHANFFVDCAYLTNVTIGETAETIEEGAFNGCYNLKVVFGAAAGGAAENFAKANNMTFAKIGETVEIPEAVVTTAAPETTGTPETTTAAPEDTTVNDDTSADGTTKAPDEAAQTSDINLVMVAAIALAALASAVVLTKKRKFN